MTQFVLSIITSLTLFFHPALISPLAPNPQPVNQSTSQPVNPIVYGFLPYWNLKYLDAIDFSRLTHLAYFALPITADGYLDEQDLGYRRFIANYATLAQIARDHQLHLDLVIKNPDDSTLFSFLNNSQAQQTLISELSLLSTHYSLSGFNLDFEPTVATNSATINGLTQFVRKLRLSGLPTVASAKVGLTIDIYPSAATSPKLWDLPALAPATDAFIVMAYDYTQVSSDHAGPVAPLYPAQASDRHAIMINLAQITRLVPPQKLLLGLPLYGYEWPTESTSYLSPSLSRGSLATQRRIQALLTSPAVTSHWDSQTLTPWLTYKKNRQIYQIYFDNAQSLTLKSQLARDASLAGLALWALGYETSLNSVW